MSRSAPVVRTALFALALTLVLPFVACTGEGGVRGTPGSAGLRDPYFPQAGNGGYDVTHYDLTLDYDPDGRRLTGTAVVTARATQDLSAFHLDLKGLDVERITVGGREARWNRAGQELTVRPLDELDEGTEFRTEVRYSGRPRTVTDPDGSREGWLPTADGAVALGEPVGSMSWFPGNHHPSDKAAYDVSVTVPEGLHAISNGRLTDESTRRGRTTFTWHTAEPMASYLATVAVGEFETRASVTRETAADGGLPVYVAVDPSQAAASEEVLDRIPEVVAWAEGIFGPYPFSSAGAIVERPEDSGFALETQNRPVFPGAPDIVLLVHELAHQWYGNSVTPKTWRDMWLNEGFATYAEWLWQEEHGGDTAEEIFDALYAGDSLPGGVGGPAVWSFPPAEPPGAADISGSPVYQRGAMVLHRIRETVGDDTFRAILRGWAAEHRHGNADTADFTAYVEKSAPDEDFGAVWEDWLYGEGKPERR
ncbi:M1 family metallopeptidase [Streptomyces poonensis]|uniref:Aminopeptidase N n=1 Tax=Streptomyces poonensis TaxID=68255 RepID=A0A918PBW8_9ACTN|nr:M1 family metallopeptidase [Streptomyces poonensis]GGY95535.1 metallopeptidase [Streptomyces poonensis]GLJ88830.1 metallopeptidase [Streptomyces poonensis]